MACWCANTSQEEICSTSPRSWASQAQSGSSRSTQYSIPWSRQYVPYISVGLRMGTFPWRMLSYEVPRWSLLTLRWLLPIMWITRQVTVASPATWHRRCSLNGVMMHGLRMSFHVGCVRMPWPWGAIRGPAPGRTPAWPSCSPSALGWQSCCSEGASSPAPSGCLSPQPCLRFSDRTWKRCCVWRHRGVLSSITSAARCFRSRAPAIKR
mmetsp:Transcript_32699/g.78153  ORF Transcript_32699/g.78153 Transcript_32699/m.78153 type:complete len:209 (-) Transcript_32699:75-701(-)